MANTLSRAQVPMVDGQGVHARPSLMGLDRRGYASENGDLSGIKRMLSERDSRKQTEGWLQFHRMRLLTSPARESHTSKGTTVLSEWGRGRGGSSRTVENQQSLPGQGWIETE